MVGPDRCGSTPAEFLRLDEKIRSTFGENAPNTKVTRSSGVEQHLSWDALNDRRHRFDFDSETRLEATPSRRGGIRAQPNRSN